VATVLEMPRGHLPAQRPVTPQGDHAAPLPEPASEPAAPPPKKPPAEPRDAFFDNAEYRILAVPFFAAARLFAYWAAPRRNAAWFCRRDSAQELGAPGWSGAVMFAREPEMKRAFRRDAAEIAGRGSARRS
jgi:hypothetical protein